MADRRYERGLDVYASQFEIPREEVASWFADHVGARFGEEAILSGAGAWVDDELSLRERSLVVVAALITQGGAEQQLRAHTRWAIRHGCTRAQLEALAALLGVYAGYPRAANGVMVVREELARLEEQEGAAATEERRRSTVRRDARRAPAPRGRDDTGPQQDRGDQYE